MDDQNLSTTYSSANAQIADVLNRVFSVGSFYIAGICSFISIPLLCMTIIVFLASDAGTTRTTRVYYITIAICELMTGIFRDIILLFVGFGIRYVTRRAVYFQLETYSMAACYINDFLCFVFEMINNHTYLTLAAERCIALYFPMKFHRLVGRRKAIIGLCTISACSFLLCSCIFAGSEVYQTDSSGRGVSCSLAYNGNGTLAWLAVVMILFTWAIPTANSVILNCLIAIKLASVMKLSHELRAIKGTGIATKQVQASITLLLMVTLHASIYVPMAVCRSLPVVASLVSSPIIAWPTTRIAAAVVYPFLSVTHLMDFWIYWTRVRGFKQNVVNILCCRTVVKKALSEASEISRTVV